MDTASTLETLRKVPWLLNETSSLFPCTSHTVALQELPMTCLICSLSVINQNVFQVAKFSALLMCASITEVFTKLVEPMGDPSSISFGA
jgi:hypothetical protein